MVRPRILAASPAHAEPVRTFAVIRPDARLHSIVEATNNREHLRW